MNNVNPTTMSSEQDYALGHSLLLQADAQTAALHSQTLRNKALGVSAIIGASGACALLVLGGVALGIYAWNHRTATADELKEALAHLPPIKVETTVKDGTVTLTEGGKVTLAQPAPVQVQGTVKLDTSTIDVSKFMQPTGQKDANGNVIKTEVTVFYEQPHDKGRVVTGWMYASGDATTPTSKFCYFTALKAGEAAGSDDYRIGNDGQVNVAGLNKVPNGPEAFRKCHW